MKTTLANIYRWMIVFAIVCTMCACAVDTNDVPEQIRPLEAGAGSTSVMGSTPSLSDMSTHHDQASFAGYARLLSVSGQAPSASKTTRSTIANAKVPAHIETHEYRQVQIAMNATDFERAKKIASTATMKAVVAQAFQMHQEMLKTEQVTAKNDQEIGTTKEQ